MFDSAESFGPEFTTEGLVAGCGSLFKLEPLNPEPLNLEPRTQNPEP
jgi:hypothetical protein